MTEHYVRLRGGVKRNMYTKKYRYGEVEIEMYTLTQLATKLERTRDTVMGWESQGLLPKTPFIGANGIRLYPRKLVERLYRQFVKWHSEGSFHWTEEVKVKVKELFAEETIPLIELIRNQ